VALNVTWSQEALDDLKRLHDFLALNSPSVAAQSTIDLIDGVEFVADNPGLAVILPQFAPIDIRRVFVSRYEIRVGFDLPNNEMDVVRIFSQREDR
jgi:plasmid stabilization system protein ParE